MQDFSEAGRGGRTPMLWFLGPGQGDLLPNKCLWRNSVVDYSGFKCLPLTLRIGIFIHNTWNLERPSNLYIDESGKGPLDFFSRFHTTLDGRSPLSACFPPPPPPTENLASNLALSNSINFTSLVNNMLVFRSFHRHISLFHFVFRFLCGKEIISDIAPKR